MSPESLCFYMMSCLGGLVSLGAVFAIRGALWLVVRVGERLVPRPVPPSAVDVAARRRRIERELRFHVVCSSTQTPKTEAD